MKLKLSNNSETLLAGAINETDTTLLLAPGTGALFPQIAAGEFFPITLVKSSNGSPVREVVYATARSGDSCTVLRGQEGTSATAFASGDYAGCYPTAGCFAAKMDTAGGAFTGPVDMGDQTLTQAVLKDCAQAYRDNAAATVIDIRNGAAQRWAPAAGNQTLTITGWPPSGTHGEVLLYGVNLGAATITLDAQVNWINDTGSFTKSASLNSNHGATLQTAGLDFVLLWSPDGGVTRYGKVMR